MTEDIERLLFNYSNARKSWEAWCFLGNLHLKVPNYKVRNYADNNQLLFHLRYLTLKDFHIEIYKILKDNKNNRDNIFELLRSVSPDNPKYKDAMQNLEDLKNHGPAIKDITNIRDKYYAHLDIDYGSYIENDRSVVDMYKCFELIEKSIITIASMEYLMGYLDKIPSRDEFTLVTP